MAISFSFVGFVDFQTSQRLMPIKRYKTVQTGPNTFEGGFQEGLFRLLNQGFIRALESTLLMIPVNSQIAIAMINFHMLNF